MKVTRICMALTCLAALSAGCSDKMDYHGFTNYDKTYIFSDFGRTAGFVNNIYSYLDSDLPGVHSLASACDEAEMAVSWSSVLDYTNGNWSALNPKSQWGIYSGIRAANYFLKEAKDLTFYDLRFTEDYQAQMNRFNRYQYEVRLLRAYYYFLLVRAYGDVPFYTEVLTEKEANTLSRTPSADVFDFVISECDAVAPELPTSYKDLGEDAASGSNPETGRVTRGTALALKARFCLFEGTWRKYHDELGLTDGDRFLNDKLGLMISGSYQYAPGGSDNAEFEYDVDDDQVVMKEAQVRQYYVTRERQSYSLALDYEFNPDHKISFKGIYNRRNDWENRYRAVYKDLDESDPAEQSIELQTKGGASDTKNARLERQQTMDFTLDGEHNLGGRVLMDWAASYSRASEDRPNERYFGLKMDNNTGSNLLSTFHGVGGRNPYSTLVFPGLNDEAWELDELTNSDQSIYENEWKFRLNFELPLAKGLFGNTLRFGGKYTNKTKDRETEWYKYDKVFSDGDEWRNQGAAQIRDGFMVGGQHPIGTHFVSKHYLGGIDFASMTGEPDNEEMSGNYHANEQISSAYLRFDQKLGSRLNLMLGLRMEHTALEYRGLNWVVDAEENESLASTGTRKNNYTNWLPSVLLKYDVNDDFKLRASFTETLSRPKYAALIPSVNYNSADEEATIGNPDLKPTTSYNFDLSADVIVDEAWQGMSPEIPISGDYDYDITKPINAYDANLYGIEAAYQRDFSFIAPALKCVGFYGNYTYTANKTKNHHFEHRVLEEGEEIDMIGSPEHTANASLFFEKWGLNLRLSYNFASAFVDEMGEVAELDRYYDKVNYLDLNATYTFGKRVKTTIYADVTNLLNQPLRYYQGTKDRTMQVEYYGARFNAGIKVSF